MKGTESTITTETKVTASQKETELSHSVLLYLFSTEYYSTGTSELCRVLFCIVS